MAIASVRETREKNCPLPPTAGHSRPLLATPVHYLQRLSPNRPLIAHYLQRQSPNCPLPPTVAETKSELPTPSTTWWTLFSGPPVGRPLQQRPPVGGPLAARWQTTNFFHMGAYNLSIAFFDPLILIWHISNLVLPVMLVLINVACL